MTKKKVPEETPERECLHCQIIHLIEACCDEGDGEYIVESLAMVLGQVISTAPDIQSKAILFEMAVKSIGQGSGAISTEVISDIDMGRAGSSKLH